MKNKLISMICLSICFFTIGCISNQKLDENTRNTKNEAVTQKIQIR